MRLLLTLPTEHSVSAVQISEKPFSEYDLQLLAMVKTFTLHAYKATTDAQVPFQLTFHEI